MKKYISLGIVAIVMLAMLVTVFVLDIIIHPLVWTGIVIVQAIAVTMYSRSIDAENAEEE